MKFEKIYFVNSAISRIFFFRYGNFEDILARMEEVEGGILKMAEGYDYFGAHVEADNTFVMRQWAPGAVEMWLMGDFNKWNKYQHAFKKLEYGRWEIKFPPNANGDCLVPHMSRLKLAIKSSQSGEVVDRLDPWATYVLPTPEHVYNHHFWNPPADQVYKIKCKGPKRPKSLKVYECHVGISSIEGKVNTYKDFAQNVLPRIKNLGYNAIQVNIYFFGYQEIVNDFF
jgi:1,4-alpha-glucan branching enzyme